MYMFIVDQSGCELPPQHTGPTGNLTVHAQTRTLPPSSTPTRLQQAWGKFPPLHYPTAHRVVGKRALKAFKSSVTGTRTQSIAIHHGKDRKEQGEGKYGGAALVNTGTLTFVWPSHQYL